MVGASALAAVGWAICACDCGWYDCCGCDVIIVGAATAVIDVMDGATRRFLLFDVTPSIMSSSGSASRSKCSSSTCAASAILSRADADAARVGRSRFADPPIPIPIPADVAVAGGTAPAAVGKDRDVNDGDNDTPLRDGVANDEADAVTVVGGMPDDEGSTATDFNNV